MSVISAEVAIRGTRPLLWHRFGPDALPLEKKARSGVAGNDPEEWRRTVLATSKGQLYLDGTYVFAAVRDGARLTAHKRGSLQSVVASTLQVKQDRILVDRWVPANLEKLIQAEDQPVYLDVRSVRNPATRARNVRYRVASSPGWNAAFTICWDNTLLSPEQIQSVLRDAGQFKGIGDGRNIGFGRFEVVSFRLVKVETNAKKQTARRTLEKRQA